MFRTQWWARHVAAGLVVILCLNSSVYSSLAQAGQGLGVGLPVSAMMGLSSPYVPVCLKGIRIQPENPFLFDFIIDQGDSGLDGSALSEESTRLIKYFLSSLAIPESDLWVNLSPYDETKIIPETFGRTEMGQDLLAQDFLLKKLTAGLLHPDSEQGKIFWEQVSAQGETDGLSPDFSGEIFHKVWIMPERAKVYESAGVAVVVESRLKVMLEDDYLAVSGRGLAGQTRLPDDGERSLAIEKMRRLILPVIEQDVNEGARFAPLRQIYSAFILATWYKQKMRYALLNQVYADSRKVEGVTADDPQSAHKVWEEYAAVFREGLYEVIREEYNPLTQEVTTKQYVSGGALMTGKDVDYAVLSTADLSQAGAGLHLVRADLEMTGRTGERIRSQKNRESDLARWVRENLGVVIDPDVLRPVQRIQAHQTREQWLRRARWGVYGLAWAMAAGFIWVSADILEEGADSPSATRGPSSLEITRVETPNVVAVPEVALPAITRGLAASESSREVSSSEISSAEPQRAPADSLRPVQSETGDVMVAETVRVQGRVSPVTGERIMYDQGDYDQVTSTVQDIVKNYLDYWNSAKTIRDIFHPDRNMRMTLDHYAQTLIGAYDLLPQFRETDISRDMFVAVMTAIIAQESSLDSAKIHPVSGARGLSQILHKPIWDEFSRTLFRGKRPPAGWDFEDGAYDGMRSVYVGAAGLAKNLETKDEFAQIKRLYGAANWPGNEQARMGLLYLNHYRGPNFQLTNKAMALKKLFSSDDSFEQYYNPLYVNTRKVLAFLGVMAIDEKGRVIEVNEYASRDSWQYYLPQRNPEAVARLFDLKLDGLDAARDGLVAIGDLAFAKPIEESGETANAAMLASSDAPDRVGGIDLDSSRMEFEIEGDRRVDCVSHPEDPGCLRLDVSAEQILEMRQSLWGVSPEILQIRPIGNLGVFLGIGLSGNP